MGIQTEALLTPSQVARLLEVSSDTVRAWADAGRLACLRTSAGHRLFRRQDVDEFARNRPARSSTPVETGSELKE
jgi:excisionase family DNA binding protein